MKKIHIYLLFRITLISAALAVQNSDSRCPSANTIHPCYCEDIYSRNIKLVCENITYDDDLTKTMNVMKTQPDIEKFYVFELKSAFLRYLPGNLFEGTKINQLFIFNSGILDLSDSEYAFKGLEESLWEFTIQNCTYTNHWDWTELKRLTKMRKIRIFQSSMLEISEDFIDVISKWPLEVLYLKENNIKLIPPEAFSKLEHLIFLLLNKNSIKSVERSMFPKAAKRLFSLSLRENRITYLPIDLFTEMPRLYLLDLEGNPIMVLDSQTFQPVWYNLGIVKLGDTLHCDCRMSWISWMPRQKDLSIFATCKTPAELKGRNTAILKKEDYKC